MSRVFIHKPCPKCTGQQLADQLRCTQPGCSGGVVLVEQTDADRLADRIVLNIRGRKAIENRRPPTKLVNDVLNLLGPGGSTYHLLTMKLSSGLRKVNDDH